MSWGALNNQREKTSSEPLPDFLIDQGNKGFRDKIDTQFQSADDVVVHKTEKLRGARKESDRSYGVVYPRAINIQMSKKTLFVALGFFATIIVLTFCIGYLVGNVSVPVSTSQTLSMPPLKKPIIPGRKKGKQAKVKLEKIIKTSSEVKVPAAISESEDDDFTSLDAKENTPPVAPIHKNNKDNNSETLLETTSPKENADDLDD